VFACVCVCVCVCVSVCVSVCMYVCVCVFRCVSVNFRLELSVFTSSSDNHMILQENLASIKPN